MRHDALPDDLKVGIEHPDKPAWDRLASETAEDGTAVVAVGELARLQGIEPGPG